MGDLSYSKRPRVWNRYAYSLLLINDYKQALNQFKQLIHQGEA